MYKLSYSDKRYKVSMTLYIKDGTITYTVNFKNYKDALEYIELIPRSIKLKQ
jgi:hypothetical protein